MTKTLALAGAGWLALAAGGAFAQTTITGIDDLNDRLDDIRELADDDIAEANDDLRFGNPDAQQGFSGSASLSYAGQTGNNESQELSVGARLRYAAGPWVQTLGFAIDFAEDGDAKTKEDTLVVYDANYYFNDRFYAFILGRAVTDGLADTAGDIRTDAFLGVGPGYRIINTEDVAWRVQAGAGISYLKNGINESETDAGAIASSRFYYRFTPTVFMTNDTDVLNSSGTLRVNNDLGVSFQATDALTARISYLTDYNEARDIRSDNRLGVSIVYGF